MRLLIALVLMFFAAPAFAQDVYVQGHYRSNGTYVQPHYRSAPDSSTSNNWSSRGNVNPHTGAIGTRNPPPTYGVPPIGYAGPSGYQRQNNSLIGDYNME